MDASFLSVFKPDLQYLDYPELIEKLDQRMKPGACSQVGFEAENEKLVDICQKDSAFLKTRNITHEQIADRLEAVIIKAQFLFRQFSSHNASFDDFMNAKAMIENKLMVPSYLSTCGEQECPFSKDLNDSKTVCGTGTSSITIINPLSGESLENITELHGHLFRAHHFFQGNTAYRTDPERAIKVLGIEPGVDYKLKTVSEESWEGIAFMGQFEEKTLLGARENKIAHAQAPGNEFEAYLLPYHDFDSYQYRGLTHRQKIEKVGQEKNKSREEIDQDIKNHDAFLSFFTSCDGESMDSTLDDQVWESDGHNYLHVFTFKPIQDSKTIYQIGGVALSSGDIGKRANEHTVFKAVKSVIPVLEEGDYIQTPKI